MRRFATICALGASLIAAPAAAGELTHRVGDQETLEAIAKAYYGSSWKAVYLRSRNGLGESSDALAGKRIVVPASWKYKVRRGDSYAAIAKRYLGDADRYGAITAFNGIRNSSDLNVGQEVLMPFHLYHVVQPGDSLSKISRRYYRTTKWAGALKEYNDAGVLKPGQKIVVPIFDRATLDVKSRRYVASSKKQSNGKPSPPPIQGGLSAAEARKRLGRAISKYYAGEFYDACGDLEELLEHLPPDNTDRAKLVQHMGFCAVAFGDENAARDYFRNWIAMDPKASLNPITTSPKIQAIFLDVANEAAAAPAEPGAQPEE